MSEVADDHKAIAKYIAPILGVDPKAARYWDDARETHLDIMDVCDPTDDRVKFYGTIGVSDKNVTVAGVEQEFGLELIIGSSQELAFLPNILSTCGFYIVKDGWECRPGSVFEQMVEIYSSDYEMKHVYFSAPFFWEDKLQPLNVSGRKVVWLLAVPFSDSELQYLKTNGDDAFEDLMAQNNVDVLDFSRQPIC